MPINARLPLPRNVRFSLRTILLIVMLTVSSLPLLGLYFFRIYENELVRQTELELISQSAVLAAAYRQQLRQFTGPEYYPDSEYGYILHHSPLLVEPSNHYSTRSPSAAEDPYFTPVTPTLDLVNPVQPPRPEPLPAPEMPDTRALKAASQMQSIMLETQKITLAGIRLLDMHGTVIAGKQEIGLSFAHVPEIKLALSGYYASTIRQRISDKPPPPLYSISRGTHIRVFTAFPVIEGNRLQGVVYLSRTPQNIMKYLYRVQEKLYWAALSLGLIAILLVLFVSSSISRPIRELINQTRLVARGDQAHIEPLQTPVTHEVAQLSESFANMSRTLAERSDYIRRFATHVSHEFKTPLTSMQGALELLEEHMDSMEMEQRQRFINNLLNDTQRLKNLVTRLLELARADALAPNQNYSDLDSTLRSLKKRYQDRGLYINSPSLPNTLLAIDPAALETILVNLFENSLQHSADKLTLSTEHSDEHFLQLSVQDNGKGISKANRDKIFTPFFTTRRQAGGTGLGLEIIASLLKAHKGDIHLAEAHEDPAETQQTGACFILQLPIFQQ